MIQVNGFNELGYTYLENIPPIIRAKLFHVMQGNKEREYTDYPNKQVT